MTEYSMRTKQTLQSGNSVARFKFAELKFFIQENLFDIIVLSETNNDNAFPDSQFYIKGFGMLCKDRNRCKGGLLIYIRRELINRSCEFECKHIESITFSMQQKRTTKKNYCNCCV